MEERELQKTAQPDFVEAEIVYDGEGPRRSGYGRFDRPEENVPPFEKPGLFTRFKRMIAGVLGLAGAVLLVLGMILTSTIIGAIIGIPLILLGMALLAGAFKLAFSGSQNIVFRKFP